MFATRRLLQRQPMIRFLGKRSPPSSTPTPPSPPTSPQIHTNHHTTGIDHTPRPHPVSPTQSLPDSFASYRQKAQQHGPLGHQHNFSTGAIGGKSGSQLGPVDAETGKFFDRSDLPERFRRLRWSEAEIEAIESGGASMFG